MNDSCPTCGWKFGFHICVDTSYRAPGEAKTQKRGPRKIKMFDNPPGDFNSWGSDRGSVGVVPDRPPLEKKEER